MEARSRSQEKGKLTSAHSSRLSVSVSPLLGPYLPACQCYRQRPFTSGKVGGKFASNLEELPSDDTYWEMLLQSHFLGKNNLISD